MDWMDKIPEFDLGKYTPVLWAILLLFGWFTKWGFDFWERYKRRKMEDAFDVAKLDLMEDEQLKDGFKFAIKKQDRQLTNLEHKCDRLQSQLSNCLEEHARAETVSGFLREDLDAANKRIEAYHAELKLYRRTDPFPSPEPPEPESDEGT